MVRKPEPNSRALNPMNPTQYRLVFEGFEQKAPIKSLVLFFQKEMGMSEGKIKRLLMAPPCVILNGAAQHDVEIVQKSLAKMGCMASVEPIVSYPSISFSIAEKDETVIKKELSKILRSRANLALCLFKAEPKEKSEGLPSMMGPVKDKLSDYFRDSDTVIGIDDSRLLFLAFATDNQGVSNLEIKVKRILDDLLEGKADISGAFSLFPEEGGTLAELLYIADSKRRIPETGESVTPEISGPTQTRQDTDEKREWTNSLQICFTQARGKIFKRLLNMEPETLWLGLSRLPRSRQMEFLARLPFDSPLAPVLMKMIESPPKKKFDKATEKRFEAIIRQMELEPGIEKRRETWKEIRSRLDSLEELPTLPSVAAEVFRIASIPDSSPAELSGVISNDPALTSKLLKTVNSAFYGSVQKIGTVRQAVVLLGTEEIMDIAFGLAAAKVFDIQPIEGLGDPKDLWHHSICTALIARNLCRKIPKYKHVGVFTAGLLHDFGKIFLMESYPEIYREVYAAGEKHDLPLFEMEEEKLGVNHAEIGKRLASNWNLPEILVEAIACHHQPFPAGGEHAGLAAIIGLANYLYYVASDSGDMEKGELSASVRLSVGHVKVLGEFFDHFSEETFETLVSEAGTVMEDNQDLLTILN